MNRIDKILYKALKFLSRFSPMEAVKLRREHTKKFRKNVPQVVENTLRNWGYITYGSSNRVVTQNGLQQLRDLEEIKRKDITLIASVVAVVLSISAVIISIVALNTI